MNTMVRQSFFFAVLLAVPVCAYFLVFRPQNQRIDSARKEIEHKHAMLEKLRQATAQSDDLQKTNVEIRQSIDAIRSRLPTTKEMPDVLRHVAVLAARNGLEIPNFKNADKPQSAGVAMEQRVDVEITGDFDGYYRFLQELERMPRITRIPDMQITRADKADGEMKTKFSLSVYYEGDPGSKP
jgi:type IV pilus assembly protein PilO